jgi:tetratricopeptide (TPR) repeat protein
MIVSYRCPRLPAALLGIVCLVVPARSQDPEISVLRGEVRSETELILHDYQVELSDLLRPRDALRTDVQSDGSFEFRHVPSGEYMAKILTLQGELVHQEIVTLRVLTGPLFLRLPPSKRLRTTPGTVSLRQLQHPPAAKAIKAFASARKLSASGDFDRAAGELEKAIQISPEFAEAYINLAAVHLGMGQYEQAIGELRQAIQIGGPNPVALCNLSYTQAKLQRGSDAIESARQALKLDAGYPPAHLLLGSLLAADPRTLPEAIPHLERAAESMPAARTTLERVQRAYRLRSEP